MRAVAASMDKVLETEGKITGVMSLNKRSKREAVYKWEADTDNMESTAILQAHVDATR